jgi:hypothetical protein
VQALIKKRFWAKGFTVSAEFYSINKNFTALDNPDLNFLVQGGMIGEEKNIGR